MTSKRRLPIGISQGPKGWRISVRVKGRPLWQKRFRASMTLEDVEKKLSEARRARRAGHAPEPAGTLRADVDRYLVDYWTGRPGRDERKRHLELWITALGADVVRTAIAKDDVARVLNAWRGAGLSPDTCNKRRTALLALYHTLDGRGASNPVREFKRFHVPDPLPRGRDYPEIQRALAQLPRCRTRARLKVMAYTGMRPVELKRFVAEHWDERRHLLTVLGTAKGRGTKPRVMLLSRQATEALEEFDALEAYGAFSWAPMARMWKEGWVAATTKRKRADLRGEDLSGISAPVPYDLRHSFLTEIYRLTGDIQTTKKLAGHSTIRMTERYTLAAVSARQTEAVKAFEKKLGGRKSPLKVAPLPKRSKKSA